MVGMVNVTWVMKIGRYLPRITLHLRGKIDVTMYHSFRNSFCLPYNFHKTCVSIINGALIDTTK